MDEIAARLEPHEVQPALRFIELLLTSGHMTPHEADAWRRKITGWRQFHDLDSTTYVPS